MGALEAYPEWKILVRTPLDAASLIPAIKAEVYGGNSDRTIYDVHTMQQIVSESMSSQRFPLMLLEVLRRWRCCWRPSESTA